MSTNYKLNDGIISVGETVPKKDFSRGFAFNQDRFKFNFTIAVSDDATARRLSEPEAWAQAGESACSGASVVSSVVVSSVVLSSSVGGSSP